MKLPKVGPCRTKGVNGDYEFIVFLHFILKLPFCFHCSVGTCQRIRYNTLYKSTSYYFLLTMRYIMHVLVPDKF